MKSSRTGGDRLAFKKTDPPRLAAHQAGETQSASMPRSMTRPTLATEHRACAHLGEGYRELEGHACPPKAGSRHERLPLWRVWTMGAKGAALMHPFVSKSEPPMQMHRRDEGCNVAWPRPMHAVVLMDRRGGGGRAAPDRSRATPRTLSIVLAAEANLEAVNAVDRTSGRTRPNCVAEKVYRRSRRGHRGVGQPGRPGSTAAQADRSCPLGR